MIRQHSQSIRPPSRPPSILALKLLAAIEAKQRQPDKAG